MLGVTRLQVDMTPHVRRVMMKLMKMIIMKNPTQQYILYIPVHVYIDVIIYNIHTCKYTYTYVYIYMYNIYI